tara:strand:- start:41730 stop:45185 length:3456 start_codon:yes stop_codon:yes gene_type:complete
MLKARLSDRPPVNKKGNTKRSNKAVFKKINFNPFKKNILYILVSILILLVLLSFIVPMFLNLKVWKPEIVSIIEDYTGKKAEINGDINFSLYPYPQIVIEKIYIYDSSEDNNEIFFGSESLKAHVSLLPLLRRNIEIDKVIVENTELNLINIKDNKPNWVFKSLLENNEENVLDELNNFDFPVIRIKQYEVIRGNLSLISNGIKYEIKINNIILDAENSFNSITGEISIKDTDFSLNGSISNKNDLNNSLFTMANKDIKLNFDGEIQYENYFPSFVGDLKTELKNAESIASIFNNSYINLISEKTKFDSDLKVNFVEEDLFYSLNNINITSGSSILTGAISGNSGKNSNLKIVLSSNNLNLDLVHKNIDKFLKIIETDNTSNNKSKNMWDEINGSLLLSIGTSKLLDYPIRDLVLDIKKDGIDYKLDKANAIFPGNTEINLTGDFKDNFRVFEGSTKLKSDNIKTFGTWISFGFGNLSDTRFKKAELSSSVVFRKGGAIFAGLRGSIDSSKLNGEVRLRFLENSSLSANLKIDRINFDPYLESSSGNKKQFKDKDLTNYLDKIIMDVELDKALFLEKQFEKIKFSSSYENKNLNIREFEINNFKKGFLLINGNVNYSNKEPIYDLSLSYNNKNFNLLTESLNVQTYIKKLIKGDGNLESSFSGKKDSLNSKIKFNNKNLIINYEGNVNLSSWDNIVFKGFINGQISKLHDLLINNDEKNEYQNLKSAIYSAEIYKDKNSLKLERFNFNNNNNTYNGVLRIEFDDKVKLDGEIESDEFSVVNLKNSNNFFKNNFTNNLTGKIKIKSDKFFALDNIVENFNGLIEFNEDAISFKNFRGQIFNSKLYNSAVYDKKEKIFKGEIKLSKAELNLFLDKYFLNNSVFGNFSTELIINSFGNDFNEIERNIEVKGIVKLKNIYIKDLDLPNALRINQSLSDDGNFETLLNDVFKTGNNSSIENFDIDLKYKNNNISLNEISIIVDNYNGSLSGSYNFNNNILNGSLIFPINQNNNEELLINFNNNKGNVEYIVDTKNKILNKNKNLESVIEKNVLKDKNSKENTDFENVINELSNETEIESLKVDENINEYIKPDNNANLDSIVKTEELINPIMIKISFKNFEYNGIPKIINNNIEKPKLPTQEEMLDDMLDILLDTE